MVLACLLGGAGCETPPRATPWRHAADPTVVPPSGAAATALGPSEATAKILAARDRTLRIALDTDLRALHPWRDVSENARRVLRGTVFETLIRYRPGRAASLGTAAPPAAVLAPGLARSWRVLADGTELRFELAADARFHDGRALTSVDVQWSLDTLRSPRTDAAPYGRWLRDIEAVELVGPREVRVRLRPGAGVGAVLRALAEVPILPAHVFADAPTARSWVGSGPYVVKLADAQRVVLERAPSYWDTAPTIPVIEFVHSPDAAETLSAAKRGEFDLVPALIPEHWPEQAASPGLTAAFVPLALDPPQFQFIAFDGVDGPTADRRVREALSLLTDRRALARDGFDGLARPIASPIWPGGPIDGPAEPVPAVDPDLAARLLDSAGVVDADRDGVREWAGQPVRLTVLVLEHGAADGRAGALAKVLEAWRRAGVATEVRVGTEAVLQARLRTRDFDVAFLEWRGMVDQDLRDLLGTGGVDNLGQHAAPALDRALAARADLHAPADGRAQVGELGAAFATDLPIVPLVAAAPQGLIHRRVRGAVPWDGWLSLVELSFAPAGDLP